MTGDAVARLRQSYSVGFLRYLSRRDELALHTAYELGRRGLACSTSSRSTTLCWWTRSPSGA